MNKYINELPRRQIIIIISGEHPNYSSVEIGQNTEKSPGDLRRLAVTQAPVENHHLMLVGKTLK